MGQIEKYVIATNSFKLKFNCFPGDCANAVAYGFGTTSWHKGDGNNSLHQLAGTLHNGGYEAGNFFYHLSIAGMIEGSYQTYNGASVRLTQANIKNYFPVVESDKDLYIVVAGMPASDGYAPAGSTRDGGNGFSIVSGNDYVHSYGFGSSLSTTDMLAIDAKFDDGLPLSGDIGAAPQNTNGVWDTLTAQRVGAGHSCITASYSSMTGCKNENQAALAGTNYQFCLPKFLNRF